MSLILLDSTRSRSSSPSRRLQANSHHMDAATAELKYVRDARRSSGIKVRLLPVSYVIDSTSRWTQDPYRVQKSIHHQFLGVLEVACSTFRALLGLSVNI